MIFLNSASSSDEISALVVTFGGRGGGRVFARFFVSSYSLSLAEKKVPFNKLTVLLPDFFR